MLPSCSDLGWGPVGEKPFALLLVDDSQATAAKLAARARRRSTTPRAWCPPALTPAARHGGGPRPARASSRAADGPDAAAAPDGCRGAEPAAPVLVVLPRRRTRALRLAALRLGAEVRRPQPWDDEELRARMQRAFSRCTQVSPSWPPRCPSCRSSRSRTGSPSSTTTATSRSGCARSSGAPSATTTRCALILWTWITSRTINDRHGHPAGDEVLRKVGRRRSSRACARRTSCARYGGEEFARAPAAHPPDGRAHRGRAHLEGARPRCAWAPTATSSVTASLGVSGFPQPHGALGRSARCAPPTRRSTGPSARGGTASASLPGPPARPPRPAIGAGNDQSGCRPGSVAC